MQINQADQQKIGTIIDSIAGQKITSHDESIQYLDILEDYECWQPFTDLIAYFINDSKKRKLIYYVRLAKMQNQYIEDVFAASETISRAVNDLKLSFDRVNQVIREVIETDDWSAESVILQACCDKFSKLQDKIECFERLALIYEKKTHDSEELRNCFERLLQIDPYNIKALRYYKLVFTQNGEWSEAVSVMNKLLEASKHPQDVYRLAQEMASVYLYHLNKPKQAIETIESFCSDSPLDTSMIHYDAYERLGDLQGCISVLKTCLDGVDDNRSRAVLYYKTALLEERRRNEDEAMQWHNKALELNPEFLQPYERLCMLFAQNERWDDLKIAVTNYKQKIRDKNSISGLNELVNRITSATGSQNGT